MEGRDIGTAVFPDAEFKFFLDAEVEVRARRRYAELAAKKASTSFEEVLQQLQERDVRDRGRELAPLKRAHDAVLIDTTNLDADQVVNEMKSRIVAGGSAGKGLKRN
jgi:cytidylate kinase